MKNFVELAMIGALALCSTGSAVKAAPKPPPKVDNSLAFIENKGQWDARAQFMTQTGGLNLWVTDEGLVYDFHKFVPDGSAPVTPRVLASGREVGQVVRVSFVDAKPSPTTGLKELGGKFNYFIGNDRSRWASGARRFSEVRAEQLYDGIAARYYWDNGAPRYDLIVQPGADPGKIGMKVEGADDVRMLPNGNLQLQTCLGPVEEKGLAVYQEQGSSRKRIGASLQLQGDTLRFKVAGYDRSRPLVIDPLVYSTLIGGVGDDCANAVVMDAQGNAFVGGYEVSYNFPVTKGAYDRGGWSADACIMKFDPSGKLVFSSVIGAISTDIINAVSIDSLGEPYVSGRTLSSDFPIVGNAFQSTYHGGWDGFVAKLNSDGSKLLLSTFVGGSGDELVTRSEIDSKGNLVVFGTTSSTNFPVTPLAFQKTYSSKWGGVDAFVTRLTPDLSAAVFSTYLGDSMTANGLALDASDNVLIAGTDWGGFITPYTSGKQDAYAAKLSADGSQLLASRDLGGSREDWTDDMTMDASHNVVLVGRTNSLDFPTTAGAYNRTCTGNMDTFVTKFSADLSQMQFSTLIAPGGANVCGISLDSNANVVVVGQVQDGSYPITAGAFQGTFHGGFEAVLSELSADGATLRYSTYIGGKNAATDAPYSVAAGSHGDAVVVGQSNAADFPTTDGAFQRSNGGGSDIFVTDLQMFATMMVSKFQIQGAKAYGGYPLWAVVDLDMPAPSGGQVVNITANASAVNAQNVTVPEGATELKFVLTTNPVDASTPTIVSATTNDSTKTANLTVVPAIPASIGINPSPVVGGSNALARVTLNADAGPSGTTVNLQSDSSAVSVPSSVSIAAGQRWAVFAVQTSSVTQDRIAHIKATCGGSTFSQALTVQAPAVASFWFDFDQVVGGYNIYATLGLNTTATGSGVTVNLKTDNFAAVIPGSVVVPAGARQVRFVIGTTPVGTIQTADVTASAPNGSKKCTLTISPPSLLSIGINPQTIRGGGAAQCRVTLNGPAGPAGVIVTLASDNAAASLPKTVTIPAGQRWAVFSISTSKVTTPQVANISAFANAHTLTTQLWINP